MVTLGTPNLSLNILHYAHLVYLCGLNTTQNKQRIFPCIEFDNRDGVRLLRGRPGLYIILDQFCA